MEEWLHSELLPCSESNWPREVFVRAALLKRVLGTCPFFIIRRHQPSLLLMFALLVQKQRWVKQLAPRLDSRQWHHTVSGPCVLCCHRLAGGEKDLSHLRVTLMN